MRGTDRLELIGVYHLEVESHDHGAGDVWVMRLTIGLPSTFAACGKSDGLEGRRSPTSGRRGGGRRVAFG